MQPEPTVGPLAEAVELQVRALKRPERRDGLEGRGAVAVELDAIVAAPELDQLVGLRDEQRRQIVARRERQRPELRARVAVAPAHELEPLRRPGVEHDGDAIVVAAPHQPRAL